MFRQLYTRLAAVLAGLFLLLGILYIVLTLYTVRLYFQEVNQKLNRILAQHLVSEDILIDNGRVDEKALRNIFHMLMVVNPVIEVYLLGPDGSILSFSAPPGTVKRRSVSLEPVSRLLSGTSPLPILGDDPRDMTGKKIFSAAPISLNGATRGYLYIILGGQQFETEAQMLQGSYILRLSMVAAGGGLVFAFLAALLLFNRMTGPLRQLTSKMEAFRQSNFSGPPAAGLSSFAYAGNEIDRMTAIFEQMASRIVLQFRNLKDADEHRREFLATITHDLRTPLTSLHGYLETLLMKEGALTPEEQRNYLVIAIKRADQLSNLVTALFELAKLDSPDVKVHFESFSLAELVQDILQKFELTAAQKKINLERAVPEKVPLVYADIALTERLFENLIDNALRFTPEHGSISIQASLDRERVAIRVADTGAGIAPEELPHLFERFHRPSAARGDSGMGSGLGLAIAGRIVELHGSTIGVKSALHEGTVFTFSLPAYQSRK